MTTALGYSETVSIDDAHNGVIALFNPKREVDFAGHALVGSAYFLERVLGFPTSHLACKGGVVHAWKQGTQTWIRASVQGMPPWNFEQLADAPAVETLTVSAIKQKQHAFVWAWVDEKKGVVRARTFAPDWGIPEDEANGSGSMRLASTLNRRLIIHHGTGSLIYAEPIEDAVGVGGMVVEDEPRNV